MRSLLAIGANALVVMAVLPGCASDALDEEQTEENGGTEDALLAGRRLGESEIATLVRRVGFPESMVGKMVCTAKYESSFYERASNRNRGGSMDRGLFQVNSVHIGRTPGCPRSGEALFDAETNAKCAYAIYRAQGIGAWYGYRAHRRECDRYSVRSTGGTTQQPTNDDVGCYSPTLHARTDERACVQGASNGVWYQCHAGNWERGVDPSSRVGPYGTCSVTHALND